MPVIAPPLKATSSAGPMPWVAACAVRTLARTDTFMPMKPHAPESTAPSTKPMAVMVPSPGVTPMQHRQDDADDARWSCTGGPGRRLRLAWMAPAISCMRALPASWDRIQLLCTNP
jgi:hypothetical protein